MGLKVLSSFVLGLYNSFYVFNLSALIVALLLNDYLVSQRRSQTKLFLISFWVGYCLINFIALLGLLDVWFSRAWSVNLLKIVNAMLGLFYLLASGINLKAWFLSKRNKPVSSYLVWPFGVSPQSAHSIQKKWLLMFGLVTGALLALAGYLWPQDYYLFFLNYGLLAGNNINLAILAFLTYVIGVAAPMMVVSLAFWPRISQVNQTNQKAFIRISAASFLLAVSIGIFFILLKL